MPIISSLPPFPSSRARASLSPSQLASLYAKISAALQNVLALSPGKRNSERTVTFVSSYVRDAAQDALTALIWDPQSFPGKSESSEARMVRARVLQLAEQLASSGILSLSALLDTSVAFAPHTSRIKALLSAAFSTSSSLISELADFALPAFRDMLSNSTAGLYGLRKTAQCLLCFVRCAPQDVKLIFSYDSSFMEALARAYDTGLATIAHSYGGLRVEAQQSRDLDEWERLILETKVALLDIFHILIKAVFDSLARVGDSARTAELDCAFSMLFALQDLPAHASASVSTPRTPYLNRSLLADYQGAHDLSRLVEHTLARAEVDDARAQVLSTALRALDDSQGNRGALTLLFGSGVPPGVDGRGDRQPRSVHASLPPAASDAGPSSSAVTEAVDAQAEEVLSILPGHSKEYVRALLMRPELGTVERVVEALLEGTVPSPDEAIAITRLQDDFQYTRGRENVFDREEMDMSRLHVGKKRGDAAALLNDRSFVRQMKSDILRRAEEADNDDEEDDDEAAALAEVFGEKAYSGKSKTREAAFEEELDALDVVRVAGDGEVQTDGEDNEDAGAADKVDVQTLLELAFLSTPSIFERDAATRRSKERVALRVHTGWADEQIEGWRVMLERNPKQKEKIIAKHEFRGNQPSLPPSTQPSSGEPSRSTTPSRGDGRGRGRGRGLARGVRGRRGRGGDGDHARKEKHKASQGNHNRKRGHDKKVQKAGGPS